MVIIEQDDHRSGRGKAYTYGDSHSGMIIALGGKSPVFMVIVERDDHPFGKNISFNSRCKVH